MDNAMICFVLARLDESLLVEQVIRTQVRMASPAQLESLILAQNERWRRA
jgi:hypothetical protein